MSQSLPENYVLTQTDEQLRQRFPLVCRWLSKEWGLTADESADVIRDHVGVRDEYWDLEESSNHYLLLSNWYIQQEVGVFIS